MNNAQIYTINHLNDCGCCEGVTVKTPIEINNRPSLPVIAYRIGEHSDFKASMLARLSSTDFPNLKGLRTRNDNDFSIALLDAWSMVADVLTFYDQYIANECYLRTATERLSIFELARLIGYKPRPGVAASTLLVFTMDELPGSPEKITLSAGTKVQSTPKQDEQAQVFETVEQIEAHPAWNNIRPRLKKPQIPVSNMRELLFDGIDTGLKPGDGLVFTPTGGSGKNVFSTITSVELDQENDRTRISVATVQREAVHGSPLPTILTITPDPKFGLPTPTANFAVETIEAADLEAEAKTHNFEIQDIFDALSVNIPSSHSVWVFRQKASIFGHNAPAWNSLPESLKGDVPIYKTVLGETIIELEDDTTTLKKESFVVFDHFEDGPFKNDEHIWPGGKYGNLETLNRDLCPHNIFIIAKPIFFESEKFNSSEAEDFVLAKKGSAELTPFSHSSAGGLVSDNIPDDQPDQARVFLDSVYKGINPGGMSDRVILVDEDTWGIYGVKGITDLSKSCFTITAKVTRLNLDSKEKFTEFRIRNTQVYFQSEMLPLALIPIEDEVPFGGSQTLKLDGFVDGLYEGQQVVLSGLEDGGSENRISELLTLEKVEHELVLGGGTRITFSPALKHVYKRETVTINANVAPAMHGETVQEVLGSGDATRTYQTYNLKQPPLTHVSATTPNGAESTLEVRVNDLLWHEVDTFFGKGPQERIFRTRTNDEGETIIKFGNGDMGARLPTGQDNVRAVYRKGIGTQGLVDAGQLNMLMSRPLGLKEITNPHASTGAADPESRNEAQRNAPLTVLTLDRAVSLQDYEDFSHAFAGISKALAVSALTGHGKTVFITVAGPDGSQIATDSQVYEDLLGALSGSGDPLARFRVQSYRPATFRLGCKVKVGPNLIAENVLAEVDTILRLTFSFDMREFGQPVVLSEVIAVIQTIPGVVAVDVDFLYRGNVQKPEPQILAELPVIKSNGQMQAAELLTLHPGPLDKLEVMA